MNTHHAIYRHIYFVGRRCWMVGKYGVTKPTAGMSSIRLLPIIRTLTVQHAEGAASITSSDHLEQPVQYRTEGLSLNKVKDDFKVFIRYFLFEKSCFNKKYLVNDVLAYFMSSQKRRQTITETFADAGLEKVENTVPEFMNNMHDYLDNLRIRNSRSQHDIEEMKQLLSFAPILHDEKTINYIIRVFNDILEDYQESPSCQDLFDVHILFLLNYYLCGNYNNSLKVCEIILGSTQLYAPVLPTLFNQHSANLIVQVLKKSEPHLDDTIVDNLISNLPNDVTSGNCEDLFKLLLINGTLEDCLSLCEFLDSVKAWNSLLNLKRSNQELAELYEGILHKNSTEKIPYNQGFHFRRRLLDKSFRAARSLRENQALKERICSLLIQEYQNYSIRSNKNFESLFYSALEINNNEMAVKFFGDFWNTISYSEIEQTINDISIPDEKGIDSDPKPNNYSSQIKWEPCAPPRCVIKIRHYLDLFASLLEETSTKAPDVLLAAHVLDVYPPTLVHGFKDILSVAIQNLHNQTLLKLINHNHYTRAIKLFRKVLNKESAFVDIMTCYGVLVALTKTESKLSIEKENLIVDIIAALIRKLNDLKLNNIGDLRGLEECVDLIFDLSRDDDWFDKGLNEINQEFVNCRPDNLKMWTELLQKLSEVYMIRLHEKG